MDEKFEEAPIFEPRNSGFRNVSMTNIETKGIKTQIGKAVSILKAPLTSEPPKVRTSMVFFCFL